MKTKFAYIHPTTREYLYTEDRNELLSQLAQFAAETYQNHYCNGQLFTFVEVAEDGSEKWYAPTGEQIMSPTELEAKMRHMQSFIDAVQIPVSNL